MIQPTNNTINPLAKFTLSGSLVFLNELMNIIYDIRWWIFLAVVLVMADLWFGLRVSKAKGIVIRKSSAGRRTLNKMIDYFLYILIGTSFGMALGKPYELNPMIVACTILFFCYAFEIDSIYEHICYLHGFEKKISIWKTIWLIITFRFQDLKNLDNIKPQEDKELKTPKDE